MLDLIILILLVFGFIVGYRRGLILQLVHLSGFIASYILAYLYFDDLAPQLKLWIPYPVSADNNSFFEMLDHLHLEKAYYHAIAFAMIFFTVKIVMQIIGSMLDFLADLPLIKSINRFLGGLLGFIETYLILFIVLYFAALFPYFDIDHMVDNSWLAHLIIEKTPVLSEKIQDMWIMLAGDSTFGIEP